MMVKEIKQKIKTTAAMNGNDLNEKIFYENIHKIEIMKFLKYVSTCF